VGDSGACVVKHPFVAHVFGEPGSPYTFENTEVQIGQPAYRTLFPRALLTFDQPLQCGVFYIGDATHVQCNDLRSVLLGQADQHGLAIAPLEFRLFGKVRSTAAFKYLSELCKRPVVPYDSFSL